MTVASTHAIVKPTSGTAATSRAVSELGSFFSAVDRSNQATASSTNVYASSGRHLARRGAMSPRMSAIGSSTSAPIDVRPSTSIAGLRSRTATFESTGTECPRSRTSPRTTATRGGSSRCRLEIETGHGAMDSRAKLWRASAGVPSWVGGEEAEDKAAGVVNTVIPRPGGEVGGVPARGVLVEIVQGPWVTGWATMLAGTRSCSMCASSSRVRGGSDRGSRPISGAVHGTTCNRAKRCRCGSIRTAAP